MKVKHLVIADFGLACRVDDEEGDEQLMGTAGYIAPETIL